MGGHASQEEEFRQLDEKYSELTMEQIRDYHLAFRHFSAARHRDGVIDRDEFHQEFGKRLGFNPRLFDRYFDAMDLNRDQSIDFAEFIDFCACFEGEGITEKKIGFLFRIIDADGDGFIQKTEFVEILADFDPTSAGGDHEGGMETIFESLTGDAEGRLSPENFSEFVQRYPMILTAFKK